MDQEKIYNSIRQAYAAGDLNAVRRYADVLKTMQAPPEAPLDPTATMSTGEKFLAGVGKGMTDVGRGVAQLFGKMSREEVDAAKKQDAALMNTGWGSAGSTVGTLATLLPTMFIPGANTLAGAGAIGAASGAIAPVGVDDSRLQNTIVGGLGNVGGVLAGRALAAGAKGASALAEPFYAKGRQRIAGRTLERFGIEAGDVAGLTGGKTITGAEPTLAELIKNPASAGAAARLQDALEAVDPLVSKVLNTRQVNNNAARVGTLRDLAGVDGARDFAAANRAGTAQQLYDQAFKSTIPPLTPAQTVEMKELLKSDAVKQAVREARRRATNAGIDVKGTQGSVEGLHTMKLAMDDMIENAGKSASEVNRAANIKVARDRLVKFIEDVVPDYAGARGAYAQMSKPVNQMDVVGQVLKKGAAPTTDLAGTERLMPDAMARVMADEPRLISQAVGRDIPEKTLADLLDPSQLAKLQAVAGEVDRLGAVQRAGAGRGSATAQRLASDNVLRQMLGPTGMPKSWAEATLLSSIIGRPLQFLFNGVAEPKIQQTLADIVLNPQLAEGAMKAAVPMSARLPQSTQLPISALLQMGRTAPGAMVLTNE